MLYSINSLMTAILVSYWDSNILRDSFIFQYYQTGPAGKCLTAIPGSVLCKCQSMYNYSHFPRLIFVQRTRTLCWPCKFVHHLAILIGILILGSWRYERKSERSKTYSRPTTCPLVCGGGPDNTNNKDIIF